MTDATKWTVLKITELAIMLYKDFILNPIDMNGNSRGHKGVLNAIGFGCWIFEFGSYREDKGHWDKKYILNKAKNLPRGDEIIELLGLIWEGKVKRPSNIVDRTSWIKNFIKVDGNFLNFGIEDTKGWRDLFQWRWKFVHCTVYNGSEILDEHRFRPKEGELSAVVDLPTDDDDIRVVYGHGKMDWWFGRLKMLGLRATQDFAKKNGVWQKIGYQGVDWDGEYNLDENAEMLPEEAEDKKATAEREALNQKKKERHEKAQALRLQGKPNPETRAKPETPDPAIVNEASRIYRGKQRKNPESGADWYSCLLALGEKPHWGGKSAPPEAFTLADFFDRERQWDGWKKFRKQYQKIASV